MINNLSEPITTLNLINKTSEIVTKQSDVANLMFPSNKADTLTIGTSSSSYTAPADGYFVAVSHDNGSNTMFMEFISNNNYLSTSRQVQNNYSTFSGWVRMYLPANKGESVRFHYGNLKEPSLFFVYAKGSK